MAKASGKVEAKSWQPPATQTASKEIFAARPFPEIARTEAGQEASRDLAEIKENQSGGMIENINRSLAAASPPELPTLGPGGIQAKLTLGTPGDVYEQEADRVARQVVDEIHSSAFQAPNPLSQGESLANGGDAGRVQRQITVRAAGDAGGDVSSEWEAQLQGAKSGGQPLSPSVKEPMEQAFGADFGGVRVHTGAQADSLARSIQAKAFTTKQDVFFRQGAYEPGSRGGQELLAHELTHVVQQHGGEVQRSPLEGIFQGLDSEDIRDTVPGSLEGILLGESRHKKIAKQVFNNLPSEQASQKDWRQRQDAIEESVWQGANKGSFVDAKIKNDVYVANIMRNNELMKQAVEFCIKIVEVYQPGGKRAEIIKGIDGDMSHMWPDRDLSGNKNTNYRGWTSVITQQTNRRIGTIATHLSPVQQSKLSEVIRQNRENLLALRDKDQPYSMEESMYILRVMGMLRDVMKEEKKIEKGGLIPMFLKFEHEYKEKFNRIKVEGKGSGENRDIPTEHQQSRSYWNRYNQILGTQRLKNAQIYQVKNPTKYDPIRHDYLMGTSGTTLDMINFFLAHGADKDLATKLMQVFYAQWHMVAPDGNAHSQIEAIGTMLQYLHRAELEAPIMTPIMGSEDVRKMKNPTVGSEMRTQYAHDLTEDAPGYLKLHKPKL